MLTTFEANSQTAQSAVRETDTIATMKALDVRSPYRTVIVKEEGRGGTFRYDPASTTTADEGMVFAPNVGAGRYHRQVTGREYFARWWGLTRTNATLQSAIDWVSANGYGNVTADGGQWLVKGDDSTRLLMKTGVTLKTAEDSQIVLAPNPTNNWILIDFPIGASDCGVGPARLLGWNLLPPGGDTNKTGLIFSLQDTTNVVIGGIKADNWYTSYADVGSGNINLKMLDEDWEEGVKAFGAKGDGVRDDTRAGQDYERFAERYNRRFHWRATTNGYVVTSMFITNGIGLRITGENTLIKQYYYNPEEGIVPRYSGVFIISAPNTTVEGFHFTQIGSWPADETNNVSGWSMPVNIHLASNVVVRNNRFEVISKGVSSTGPFTKIIDNVFVRCGITFGAGQRANWLYYESPFPPYTKDPVYRSPLAPLVQGNTFIGSNPYKHVVLFSAAPDFSFVDNKLIDVNVPSGAVIAYSGDAGFTDANGTNIYVYAGLIKDNTFSGNYGANGAITVRLNTDTNLVQAGFIPSNMVSAVVVEGNTISGTGVGVEIRKAPGTIIRNNDIRVTSSPVWFLGDCRRVIIDGGHYESTLAGIGATIPFGVAFLAPEDFRDIVIRNCRIVSPPGEEFAIRNVEPLFVENFTVENVDFDFQGAVIGGDSPKIIQLTASRGYINILGNDFIVTNAMNAGRSVYITTTNGGDITLARNFTFDRSPAVLHRRGAALQGRVVKFMNNDIGGLEVTNTTDLLVSGNLLSGWTNGPSALDILYAERGVIIGNVISNYSTISAVAANIGVSNGVLANNIIYGNSSGDLVRSTYGKLYVHNNVIRNAGSGATYPNGITGGTVTDDIYERPLAMNTGAYTGYGISLVRDGSLSQMAFNTDNGDANYYTWPHTTNFASGHLFWVHQLNTPTNTFAKALSILGNTPPTVSVGSATEAVDLLIGGLGTNVLLRLDANRLVRAVTIGSGLSYDGTTLSSTGGGGGGGTLVGTLTAGRLPVATGSTNLADSSLWQVDTNLTLFRNNTSAVYLSTSNTLGSTHYGQSGSSGLIEVTHPGSALQINIAGVNEYEFGPTSFGPFADNVDDLGTGVKRVKSAYIGTSIELGIPNIASKITVGGGSPETIITASVGSLYLRTNGFGGATLYVKESGHLTATGWTPFSGLGNTLLLQADSHNPADNTTYFVGQDPNTPSATFTVVRYYVHRAGTVKSVFYKIRCVAGSAETVNLAVRINDTTDFAATTTVMNINTQDVIVTGLSQVLAAGDYIAVKIVTPNPWVTNPTAAAYATTIYME